MSNIVNTQDFKSFMLVSYEINMLPGVWSCT